MLLYAVVLLVLLLGALVLGLGSVGAAVTVVGQGLLYVLALLAVGAFIFGLARRN